VPMQKSTAAPLRPEISERTASELTASCDLRVLTC
jgi:hypothetical protein